jgi:uncharacterized membrane protein (UPF0127 family)
VKLGALYVQGSGRQETGRKVLGRVWRTTNAWDRMRGLLGRAPLGTDEGLLIEPCASVHTVGMRYALDLAFLDRNGAVCKLVNGLLPMRMSSGPGARATLELAAGGLTRSALCLGDRLVWKETRP